MLKAQFESLANARLALHDMLGEVDLLPDEILALCDRESRPYEFVVIPSWESKDKNELFDAMFVDRSSPSGIALLVTESSWLSGEVQKFQSADLRSAITDSADFVFDGDIIILFPDARCLSVFHHEGGFAHVGW